MRKYLPVVAVMAVVLLLPLFLQQAFYKHILIMSAINIILAVSLGIVVGYLGELSLAHAAFYGIGAYTSALLTMKLQVPFIPAFFLAIVAAGIMGYLIGIPALRLSGHYFAIATLGFQGIVILLIVNLVDITRGPMGLPGIPAPGAINLFGILISFRDKLPYYYLTLLVVIIILFITRNLIRYKYGQAFLATREDPSLAASIGVTPKKFRLLAFVISTCMAGAAGSLYSHYALFYQSRLLSAFRVRLFCDNGDYRRSRNHYGTDFRCHVAYHSARGAEICGRASVCALWPDVDDRRCLYA